MTTHPDISTAARPDRETIATYSSYRDAERAVDWLSDEGFPVHRLSIVGSRLSLVEQVTGRVTVARAALTGALQGAFVALLFSLLLGLFFTVEEAYWALLVTALIVGLAFGALFGAVLHGAQGGRRDFASASGMRAERFHLQVDAEVAGDARATLARMPATSYI